MIYQNGPNYFFRVGATVYSIAKIKRGVLTAPDQVTIHFDDNSTVVVSLEVAKRIFSIE